MIEVKNKIKVVHKGTTGDAITTNDKAVLMAIVPV